MLMTALTSVLLLIAAAHQGLALDANQLAGNYIRTDFTVDDGLPSNLV
jgi:hypothetical protein